jgi:hypothetical protein
MCCSAPIVRRRLGAGVFGGKVIAALFGDLKSNLHAKTRFVGNRIKYLNK